MGNVKTIKNIGIKEFDSIKCLINMQEVTKRDLL